MMVSHIDYNAAVSFSLLKCKYRRFIIYSPIAPRQICTCLIKTYTTCTLRVTKAFMMKMFLLIKHYASTILNFPIICEVSETEKNST